MIMIKYAIILLDKTSTAFCHADNPYKDCQLMPLDTLKSAIKWCMKENLSIQFVYPDYQLSEDYYNAIETIDHVEIKHIQDSDVTVFNGFDEVSSTTSSSIVIRLTKQELFDNHIQISKLFEYKGHISIVITDVDNFTPADMNTYKRVLAQLTPIVEELAVNNRMPQISILTDRLLLSEMNNCNAGFKSITIAPNGKFYICPAFYYENENDSVGDLIGGLNIKNSQLYKLSHAPICRNCDAFHCRRCVWLNRKTTLEVNTPGHEQCVISHLERNAGRELLFSIRKYGEFLPSTDIEEIDYLDPFDKIQNHNQK